MDSKRIKKLNKAAVATVLATSGVAVVLPLPTNAYMFSDLNLSADYYQPVMDLFNKGIISGYEDGTFRPNKAITRGQAAKMLARSLDLNTKNQKNPAFKDVPVQNQFYPYISALANAGIINGYADKTFKPDEPITRGQMAKILTLGYKFGVSSKLTHNFKDVSRNNANAYFIQTLVDLEITKGKTPLSFEPSKSVTRGQLATFISRANNADAGTPLYAIGDITGSKMYINGVAYSIAPSLQSIFNEANKRILQGATIEGTFSGTTLTSLSKLTINASGTSSSLLVLDGNYASFSGDLVINGSYLRLKNLSLFGSVTLAETPRKSLADYTNPLKNVQIASLNGVGFIDWSTPSEPKEEEYVNPTDKETLQPKPTKPTNGWKTYDVRMPKIEKYVDFSNSTVRNLFIEQNRSFVTAEEVIDRITVQDYVEQFELYADANALYIDTNKNFTMYGVTDVSYVYKNAYKNVYFNTDSYFDFLYVGTASGWLDLGEHVYIHEAIIPSGKTPNDIFDDYNKDNDSIGVIEDPNGKPVDRDPIENDIIPDKTSPLVSGLTVTAEGTSASVTLKSSEAGNYHYVVLKKSAKAPTIKAILEGDSELKGKGSVSANDPVTFTVNNLEQLTDYVIYLVVVDPNDNVSERMDASFKTKDGTPPSLRIDKTMGLYGGKKIQFDLTTNEGGTYYYYIRKDTSAPAPTVKDILKTYTGKGTVANKETRTIIEDTYETGLAIEPSQEYQIFVVMEDKSGNVTTNVVSSKVRSEGPDNEQPYVINPKLEYDDSAANKDKTYFYIYFNEELEKETAENINNYKLSGTGIVNVTGQKEIYPSKVEYTKDGKGSKVRLTIPSVTGFVNGDTLRVTVLTGVKDRAENPFESIENPGANGVVDNYADYIHSDTVSPSVSIKKVERNADQTKAKVTYNTTKAGTYYYMVMPANMDLTKITGRDFVDEFDPSTKTGLFQVNGSNIYVGTPSSGPANLGEQSIDVSIPTGLDPFTSYALYMVVKDRSGQVSKIVEASLKDDSKPPLISTLMISGGEGNTTQDGSAEIQITTDEGGLLHYWMMPKYIADPANPGRKIPNPDLTNLVVPSTTSTSAEYQAFAQLIKSKGESTSIDSGLNNRKITKLTPHTEYITFVAVEDTFGNITARLMGDPMANPVNPTEPDGEIMELEYYSDVTPPKIGEIIRKGINDNTFTITFSEAIMRQPQTNDSSIPSSGTFDLSSILTIRDDNGTDITSQYQFVGYTVGSSTTNESSLVIKPNATGTVDKTITVTMEDKPNAYDFKSQNAFDLTKFGKYVWPGSISNVIKDALLTGKNIGSPQVPASKTMRTIVYLDVDLSVGQTYYYAVTGESTKIVDPLVVMSLAKNIDIPNTTIIAYGSGKLSTTEASEKQFTLDLTVQRGVSGSNPVFALENNFFIFTVDNYGNIVWAEDANGALRYRSISDDFKIQP